MRFLRLNGFLNDAPALAGVLAISAMVFLAGAFQAGFLSDDFDLLAKAGSASVWKPFERHHFSPLMTFLFKLGAAGFLPAWKWRLLAWLAHAVNTILVHRLARVGLGQSAPMALCLALLFALNPAGYEALAWSSAIGYALVAMPILLALNLVLNELPGRRVAWCLAGLQLTAYLIWDWGVLLAPVAGVSLLMRQLSERTEIPGMTGKRLATSLQTVECRRKPVCSVLVRAFSRAGIAIMRIATERRLALASVFDIMWPATAVWGLGLLIKTLLLPGMGYHTQPFEIMVSLKYLAASPLVALAPNLTVTAYQSPYGMLAAAGLLLALGWAAVRLPEARLLAVLFVLCQIPYVLFSAPQSRYFYLPSVFPYGMVLMVVFRLPRQQWIALFAAILAAASIWWAMERSLLWRSAWQQAQLLREQVLALPESGARLVIVNLPDCHGPEGLIWRPYVWRNGMPSFGRAFVRVNTPGCPFIWESGPIPVLSRESIRSQYPGAAVYEVIISQGSAQVAPRLVRFDAPAVEGE